MELRSKAYQAYKNLEGDKTELELASDPDYARLWNKYVQLRRNVHVLAKSKQQALYQSMLTRLETEFVNDRNHFYRQIVKLRKRGRDSTALLSLKPDPKSSDVTVNPNEIKQILFELHSSLGRHDADDPRFDKAHLAQVQQLVQSVPPSEVGPEFCEQEFTQQEIETVIGSLQNNKAVGLDEVFNEALKAGGTPLVRALTQICNFAWNQGVVPTIWHSSTIQLIFKENGADPLDAKAYRPISLTSCVEKTGLIPEEQAGFRPDRGTRDQTYILREVTDSRTASKKKSLLAFVDLTNAFPSAWHAGMWYRLRECGVKGKMYRSIKAMYQSCRSSIQTPFGFTDWFSSDLGTRQGSVLSPFLFSLLLSPLATHLKDKGFGIALAGTKISCLLYADDLVLIAQSALQMRQMMREATNFFHRSTFYFYGASQSAVKKRKWFPVVRGNLGSCATESGPLETRPLKKLTPTNTWVSSLKKRVFGTK